MLVEKNINKYYNYNSLVTVVEIIAQQILYWNKQKRRVIMSILGNILWFIFGGFLSGLSWLISGILWCITIIGIPYGKQCFKFASLSFAPFGKDIEYGGGVPSLFANIIWIIFFGIPMALENLVLGCLWCITIVGIPFGIQFFKIAKLSLAPFGARVV